ncbi:hypothetical protein SALBM311S_02755 [Streptomyces alboniger]
MVTVFVLHQQSLQRLGLRMLLAAQPGLTVVGETADEAEAIRMSDRLRRMSSSWTVPVSAPAGSRPSDVSPARPVCSS